MIFNHHKSIQFFIFLLCLTALSCTQSSEPQNPTETLDTAVKPKIPEGKAEAPVVVAAREQVKATVTPVKKNSANDQFWIATLKSSNNRVDFKSKSESTWQAVATDMNFYKYDSLQTHQQSTALVRYQSKSELEVKEKTLLVFDEDPGSKKKKVDRVILKTGELFGKTSTDLWVLTESGLVQISANKGLPAKARVLVKNEQFKVVVDQGQALVTVKNRNNEIQKIAVTQNNSIDLNTQRQIQPFVAKGDTEQSFAVAVEQAFSIEKPIEQKVILDNANEIEFTKKNNYQLNGKLSAVGAKLLVNGELVVVGPDLKFFKEVLLTKGSNLIVLQVIRSDSTTQFFRKKVVLED